MLWKWLEAYISNEIEAAFSRSVDNYGNAPRSDWRGTERTNWIELQPKVNKARLFPVHA